MWRRWSFNTSKFKSVLLSLISTVLFTSASLALPSAINAPTRIGAANFSLLGMPIYSASLFTENGAAYSPSAPFILELTYKRGVSQANLIKATVTELNRMHDGAGGLEGQLPSCFRDVAAGDRFAAVNVSASQVDLYLNDQKTCSLTGDGASSRFMGIWLSDQSRAPELSRALRGGS